MKKAFLLCVTLMPVISAASSTVSSGFYVGGGIGRYDAKFKDGNVGVVEATESTSQKKSFSGNGWGGSIFVGKLFEGSKLDWFVQGGLSFDTMTHFTEINGRVFDTFPSLTNLKTQLKRTGVLDLTTGISKSFSHDIRASLNLSVLLSRFKVKFIETPYNKAGQLEKTEYVWGIAPGFSIEKPVGPVVLGFSYSYQMFENLKSRAANYGTEALQCSLKQTPIYQTAMVTIKKTF